MTGRPRAITTNLQLNGTNPTSPSRVKPSAIANARARSCPTRLKVVRPPQLITVATVALMTPRCSLHSALKEFFEPLRTNDPRTDFFAAYRRESDEFDRDYAGKYDGDLNTSLIFVGAMPPVFRVVTLTSNNSRTRLVYSQLLVQHSSSTSNPS